MQQLLQNATILLQNVTVITKCNVYYKLRQYTVETPEEIVETLGETCGNSMGNGRKWLENWGNKTSRELP